jgi:hypothetical protein
MLTVFLYCIVSVRNSQQPNVPGRRVLLVIVAGRGRQLFRLLRRHQRLRGRDGVRRLRRQLRRRVSIEPAHCKMVSISSFIH